MNTSGRYPAGGRSRGRLVRAILAFCLTCLCAPAVSLAAPVGPNIPNPGDLRAPAGSTVTPSDPRDLPAEPAAPLRELGKPKDDLFVDVTAYAVADSAPAELKEALARLTQPFVGPHRSYEDLVNATSEITRFLQSDLGYYLGYAYLPEQKVTGGVILIGVLEGRLDHVELNWTDGLLVDQAVVQGYLDRLVPGSILTVRAIERTVFLINDLHGISVRAEVKAGTRPGTAILVFTPRADPRVAGKVDIDDYGSRYTGENRIGTTPTWNSPFGRGDSISLSALASGNGGIQFALLGYTTPIGADGWRAGTSVSALKYRLNSQDFPLGVKGQAQTYNAFALYPLVRARNLNLFAVAAVDRKDYKDEVAGATTKKHVDDLQASLAGDFRDSLLTGAVNTFELEYLSGRLSFDGGFPSGLDEHPQFRKLKFSFSRLQNILSNQLLLYVYARGQVAFDNLDTSEQFRAGGPDGVRGFAPGEGTGDAGAIATAELRWLPPDRWLGPWAHQFFVAAFVDAARIRLRHDPSLLLRPSAYQNDLGFGSDGISLVLAKPNAYTLRLSAAKVTHGVATGDTVVRSPRVYLQGSWFY